MNYKIQYIGEIEDFENDNSDVFVEFEDGRKYVATFFTLSNIMRIMNRYKESGECSNGKYFWSSDMIIVENLNPLILRESIDDLIKNEEFETVFSKIDSDVEEC